MTVCSGPTMDPTAATCRREVDCDGLPAPDGEDMPHLVLCRSCANKLLREAGFAVLPDGMTGMLVALTLPDWIEIESAGNVWLLGVARDCAARWNP